MNKRRIIAVLIAFVLTIAATAMWSASTIQREGDPDAIVLEDSGSEAGVEQPKKKGGTRSSKCLPRRSRHSANCLAAVTMKTRSTA